MATLKKHATGGCLITGLVIEKQDINLKAPNTVPILIGFDKERSIGMATITRKGKELVADLDIYQDKGIEKLYPAIGYRTLKLTSTDGKSKVEDGIIYVLGLSKKPNVDASIQTIGEQIKL